MPKDTKTLGNNKARACESLGFVHKKRLCQRFDTTSYYKCSPYPPDKENTPPVTSILPYKSFPRKSDSEKKKVSAL